MLIPTGKEVVQRTNGNGNGAAGNGPGQNYYNMVPNGAGGNFDNTGGGMDYMGDGDGLPPWATDATAMPMNNAGTGGGYSGGNQ